MGKVVKLESKRRCAPAALCARLQSGRSQALADSPLTPELKGFIDRVVATILVRDYLEKTNGQKEIAETAEDVASCELMTDSPDVEVAR